MALLLSLVTAALLACAAPAGGMVGAAKEPLATAAPYFDPAAIRWPLTETAQELGSGNSSAPAVTLGERQLRRGKRYLDFQKGSRMSWRTTVKNNMLKSNTLWAYGYGLRANFPYPDKDDRRRPFFKRDVFHGIVDVLDGQGLDGRACLLKSFCTALLDVESHIGGGMLFKLLKVIFSLEASERLHFPYLRAEHCAQILHSHCPLSFNSISPYTDDA